MRCDFYFVQKTLRRRYIFRFMYLYVCGLYIICMCLSTLLHRMHARVHTGPNICKCMDKAAPVRKYIYIYVV